MPELPLVSIVVPVYNVAAYLNDCLLPLAEQSIAYPYEVILVDDGSTDESGEICEVFKRRYPKIFEVIHQENLGLPVARNKGISIARGRWIAFADSDDIPSRDFALTLFHCVSSHHECQVCSANFSIINDSGKVRRAPGKSGQSSGLVAAGDLLDDYVRAFSWIKCVNHEFLNRTGIRFYPFRAIFEDLPFFFACFLSSYAVGYTAKSIYTYRVHREGSITESSGDLRLIAHVNSFFACRGYADRILGPQKGAALFQNKLKRLKMLIIPDMPYAKKKTKGDSGRIAKTRTAYRYLKLLGAEELPVFGAPWEKETLSFAGSLPNFVKYDEDSI